MLSCSGVYVPWYCSGYWTMFLALLGKLGADRNDYDSPVLDPVLRGCRNEIAVLINRNLLSGL